jgi:GAF domain-containing protein
VSAAESQNPPWEPDVSALAELAEAALAAEGLDDLARRVLPVFAAAAQSPSAFLYVADPRLPAPRFFQHGLAPAAAARVEALCGERFDRLSVSAGAQPLSLSASAGGGESFTLHPLRAGERAVGLAGLAAKEPPRPGSTEAAPRCLRLLADAVGSLVRRAESQRQLWHLTTYLTVSSMLAKSMDLPELLEIALHCSMEAVSAEAASVMLLDEEKENFRFYQAAGPAKPALTALTFPAEKGVAGAVLQTQRSEVINDVASDPRFYGKIDSTSGFRTRNMIAVPLTAGGERVGVLEVLNKAEGGAFTKDEELLLVSIAEEIAFAIRNAMLFEYVVNTYCKQRQGQMSCKGCRRPLGSWTPCVRYREAGV